MSEEEIQELRAAVDALRTASAAAEERFMQAVNAINLRLDRASISGMEGYGIDGMALPRQPSVNSPSDDSGGGGGGGTDEHVTTVITVLESGALVDKTVWIDPPAP